METAVAWQQALEHHNGPASLLLSRQNLPALPHQPEAAELIKKGGTLLSIVKGNLTPFLLLRALKYN